MDAKTAMMTVERWEQIQADGGWVDLSARAKWRLSGGDRVRYLNGQVTNDVRRATPTAAVYACVTDVKGRICGDVYVRVEEGGQALLLDAEEALREELGVRLERYIVADDAELLDVTDECRLIHGFGKRGSLAIEQGVEVERFGCAGRDLWLSPTADWAGPPELQLTLDELEVWRVVHGLPRHPNELNTEVFPPEAGLEAKAIDYAKGCYIGQEIISRMRTTGKMPRTLVRWQADETAGTVAEGDPLYAVDQAAEGRALGQVTSVVRHPQTGRLCGIAYLKQAAAPQHSRLLVGVGMSKITLIN
jgi:tRNA-modifying protein YgfZ